MFLSKRCDSKKYDDMFNDLFGLGSWLAPAYSYKGFRASELEVIGEVRDGKAEWQIDLPGVKSKDLEVVLTDDVISIKGKRGEKEFTKTYTLPEGYNTDTARASLSDGVLSITCSKVEPTTPTKSKNILVTE